MEKTLDDLIQAIQAYDGPPLMLMEVCGTHTRQLSHFGIPALLPPKLTLVSGPGCPVCVTPAGYIDRAAALAMEPNTTLLSFGDMLRVPGRSASLLEARAAGGSVQMIYSPLEAIAHAKKEPATTFVVAAVGFETTLPLYALLIQRIQEEHVQNIRLLLAVKALVPGLDWLCRHSPAIDGFIGPGHVSAILGWGRYQPLCNQYKLPMTVAGFGYEHLLAAIWDLVQQAKSRTHEVHNLYPRVVTQGGNPEALRLIDQYFVRTPAVWRGLGEIPESDYALALAYAALDAGFEGGAEAEPEGCLCGGVIAGNAKPVDCGFFGAACRPEHPLGPCMVSTEGACGIWHATARER